MDFFLLILFVCCVVVSTFLQASGSSLKNIFSPGLTAFCGLLVLYGTITRDMAASNGLVLGSAVLLLAASDFTFEKSGERPALFPFSIVLGVVSGFIIGITFNLNAIASGISTLIHLGFFIFGVLAAAWVYRYLKVEPGLKLAIYIYLIQAVILLAGGLASLYIGSGYFAIWGIFLFISDSLVGIRAFPNPDKPIHWLDENRILFAIIVIYYTAQYALVVWALNQ